MKMKTFLKTLLILAAMSILFIPATALAVEDCDLYVGGVAVTETGPVTGEGISGSVFYVQAGDADILTLTDATITGINAIKLDEDMTIKSNICSKGPDSRTLIVNLVGDNTLGGVEEADKTTEAIDARRDIIITGDGRLAMQNCENGIWCDYDVSIDGVKQIVIDNTDGYGIVSKNCSVTDGSSVDLFSDVYEAIYTIKSLMIYNSDVFAIAKDASALHSNSDNVNIVNSDVYAVVMASSEKSYDSQAIVADWGKVRIANSSVVASNAFEDRAAIQAKRGITLNHVEITDPAKGKVANAGGSFTVTDSKGNVVPYAVIERAKAPSTMYAAGKTVTLKSGAKKLKKNKTIAKAKAYTIANANGDVTFAKVKANKSGSKFTVNKSTGKITVKKGLKNGTYKLTVKVTCSGDAKHKGTSKNVVVKIKVKK